MRITHIFLRRFCLNDESARAVPPLSAKFYCYYPKKQRWRVKNVEVGMGQIHGSEVNGRSLSETGKAEKKTKYLRAQEARSIYLSLHFLFFANYSVKPTCCLATLHLEAVCEVIRRQWRQQNLGGNDFFPHSRHVVGSVSDLCVVLTFLA